MGLSEFEEARIRKAATAFLEKRRPPVHVRSEVDMAFRLDGQSVELLEVRRAWNGESGEMIEQPFAKATFVKASGSWRVYWRRADLKWHRYEPHPTANTIEQFLALVEADEYACFFG